MTREQVDRFKSVLKDGDKISQRVVSKALRRESIVRQVMAKIPLRTGQWVEDNPYEMSEDQKDVVWDLFHMTYGDIGLKFSSIQEFLAKYDSIWLIDVDDDPAPDAFVTYSHRYGGKKIGLGGSDGTSKAKKALIKKMVSLLRSSGWFAEASHRVEEILDSSGVPVIDDEEHAKEVLKHKDIEWIGDGWYERKLDGVGTLKKRLFGKPKV